MKNSKISPYKQALDFMYAQLPMYHRQGAVAYKKDLNNTLALCRATGNPHQSLKSIHIAGTNGKGTVSHIIAAGLQAQGYEVGVYTSPHYKDFRERIKINGKYISQRYIVNFIKKYKEDIINIQPSFFEMCVCLAFCYFSDKKVDYAVIETGLGGRLDSTNVITPMMSVITNISYDHMNMLGNTLSEIAGEKAGIIKEGIPVIVGERQDEVSEVFISKARENKAPINFAEEHVILTNDGESIENFYREINVCVDGTEILHKLKSPLTGPFQNRNLITGLYSLFQLSKQINIDFKKIKLFFPQMAKATAYMGRWQIINTKPFTIADSAHNEAGIRYVLEGIQQIKYSTLHIVTGFVNDKDVTTLLQMLPKDANYYFAKANIPRGLDAIELLKVAGKAGLKGKAYTSVRKAFAGAKSKANDNDLILITGSIFVVAEVL